jgi:hypothetical protein
MEDDDTERGRGRFGQKVGGLVELRAAQTPGLVEPGADRVQADDEERLGAVDGLRRLPVALELREGLRKSRDRGVRDVVVSWDREHRAAETAQELRGTVVLLRKAAVREVAARDHELRIDAVDERLQAGLEPWFFVGSDMEIREVKNPCRLPSHSRGRLYTQVMVDEPTEIFDDLYLGLRAGGALRKKRRGEPLTTDEQEALGRWQRLSKVRKAVTLGAFSLGTFGLGFTIGGLVFGKWRRA